MGERCRGRPAPRWPRARRLSWPGGTRRHQQLHASGRQELRLKVALGEIVNAAKVFDCVGDLDIYLRSHFQNALTEALVIASEWLTDYR